MRKAAAASYLHDQFDSARSEHQRFADQPPAKSNYTIDEEGNCVGSGSAFSALNNRSKCELEPGRSSDFALPRSHGSVDCLTSRGNSKQLVVNKARPLPDEDEGKATFLEPGASNMPHEASLVSVDSSTNWMESFFENCEQDSVKLAQDLVEKCTSDEVRKTWLELTAHRILQELILLKTGTKNISDPVIANNHTKSLTTTTNDGEENNDTSFVSPYRQMFHAELGEEAFDTFDCLMNPEAMAVTEKERDILLGSATASRMLQAIQPIRSSGALFSTQWKLEFQLPNELLLLCLDRRKFIRADTESLRHIAQELELWQLLPTLLEDWGLETAEWCQDLFQMVKGCSWQSRSKTDMQCLLFVCRAYRCMQVLRWTNIRGTLARKVKRCLEIMQQHSQKTAPEVPAGLAPTTGTFPMTRWVSQVSDRDDTSLVDMANISSLITKDVWKKTKDCLVAVLPIRSERNGRSKSIKVSMRVNGETINCGKDISRRNRQESRTKPKSGKKNSSSRRQQRPKYSFTSPSPSLQRSSLAENRARNETVEQKSRSFSVDSIEQMPVEKLCLETGRVLETFNTVAKARRSVTTTKELHRFRCMLQGRKKPGSPVVPHVYKEYFWRFKGSFRVPSCTSSSFSSSSTEATAKSEVMAAVTKNERDNNNRIRDSSAENSSLTEAEAEVMADMTNKKDKCNQIRESSNGSFIVDPTNNDAKRRKLEHHLIGEGLPPMTATNNNNNLA